MNRIHYFLKINPFENSNHQVIKKSMPGKGEKDSKIAEG